MRRKLNCILLIDDDDANLYYSRIIINDTNPAIHIKTATTVNEAIEYLAASKQYTELNAAIPFPDLIFLDLNMPTLGGWDFLTIFKDIKNSFMNLPKIIMFSSSTNPDDKSKALSNAEVSDFFIKPLSSGMIRSVIAEYFLA